MKIIFLLILLILFLYWYFRPRKFDIREFVGKRLGDQADEFAQWAVGEDYETILLDKWPEFWNYRHSELFYIRTRSLMLSDLEAMIEAWELHRRKNAVKEG